MFKNRCYNGGTKHKFQPRYSREPNPQQINIKATAWLAEDYRKVLFYETYVYDICIWCGETVKEEDK